MTPRPRSISLVSLTVSALCAAIAARMAWDQPRLLLPFAVIVLVMLLPAFLARRRMRRLLMSGDPERVLGTWQGSLQRVMYPETMAPLMVATAYAAYGWIDAARTALERAVRGPAWEAALEQRLFIETLLDTFEGSRTTAVEKAEVLGKMPMPAASFFARLRIARLRRGLLAMARAFAHTSLDSDARALRAAASTSPLIHWAMRYAAAVIAIDQGKKGEVPSLLAGAPTWPESSAFRHFHNELLTASGWKNEGALGSPLAGG
ncbi:MAG TPA: hypothetical protein VNO21_14670 [Polyangiaceae bacterium]|nr:hypothetical protein [Polyangiaceae bacterium]